MLNETLEVGWAGIYTPRSYAGQEVPQQDCYKEQITTQKLRAWIVSYKTH